MHLGRVVRSAMVTALLATAACGDDGSSTTTTASTASTSPSTTPGATSTVPVASTTTSAGTSTTVPVVPTAPVTTGVATTAPPKFVSVKVYFLRQERLTIVRRDVPAPAVLRGAIAALLAGPTPAEKAAGLVSTIPAGTTLRSVDLDDGLATVDLSADYGEGGGSFSLMTRLAQVIFTATQFANSDRVVFWMDGEPVEFFGGEGIGLLEPQTRAMVDRSISGSVIIESPAPGSRVRSPFTVIGEGDVFEAQFPIEIWRDGVQIGGLAPVTAGAWGTWAEFEVTLTLDATPGPIELVAYDEGGCDPGPDCPEPVKTVVPLVLT